MTPRVSNPQISRRAIITPTSTLTYVLYLRSSYHLRNGPQQAHRFLWLSATEGLRQHPLRRGHQPRKQDHCPQHRDFRCTFWLINNVNISIPFRKLNKSVLGRHRVPPLQLRRVPPSSVSRANPIPFHRDQPYGHHLTCAVCKMIMPSIPCDSGSLF